MMTIQEAIKSGKLFKRKGWQKWTVRSDLFAGLTMNRVSIDDILADDWEVKPEPREWTLIGTHNGNWIVDGPELTGDLKKFKVREVLD